MNWDKGASGESRMHWQKHRDRVTPTNFSPGEQPSETRVSHGGIQGTIGSESLFVHELVPLTGLSEYRFETKGPCGPCSVNALARLTRWPARRHLP